MSSMTVEKLTDAYKNLRKFGTPKIEFNVYNGNIDNILALIRSFEDYNSFVADDVAEWINLLFEFLPKRYYYEGNPNNGKPEFDKIELQGDTTIILKCFRLEPFTDEVKREIENIVNEYGKYMFADEKQFWEETTGYNGVPTAWQYYIRFWWD